MMGFFAQNPAASKVLIEKLKKVFVQFAEICYNKTEMFGKIFRVSGNFTESMKLPCGDEVGYGRKTAAG